MATDSTELTFVRCPSCRSLVPAVSTRCRMCGAGLDASGETEESDKDQKKSGRVRQRTMSQAQSELNSAVSKLRASEATTGAPETPAAVVAAPVEPVRAAAAAPQKQTEEESLDDPLSAYIEEVEETEPAKAVEKPSVERNGSSLQKAAPVEQSVPTPHIISQRATLSPEPVAPVAKAEAVVRPSSEVHDSEGEHDESQQRVIVESGLRRHGKSSGLSFSRPREEQHHDAPKEAPKQQQAKPAQPEQKQEHKQERQPERNNDRHERADAVTFAREDRSQQTRQREQERPQQPQQQQQQRQRDQEPRREERPAARPPSAAQRAPEDTRKAEAAPGRLFGWIVSYSDPDGSATELREGKFFVTASSLKETDLIIDEPSISTPHALVSVGVGNGLQVQDLMSDRGVFVRRRGDDTYRREADVVHVDHGDWLRFGDVEYLVSLIAHVGVK